MPAPAIDIRNLGKKYLIGERLPYRRLTETLTFFMRNPLRRPAPAAPPSEFWALKDVSLQIAPGEVFGIIGRNGAGKSTLLKILSRITEMTEGEVDIHGRVGSLLEVGTGFHPELTGRENIYLNGAILGMRRDEIRRKFDDIVAFSEVEAFLDTPVKRYSSGMFMRLAFAVAAHLEPDILLVDEVLAVGDAHFQKKCLGKMGEVAREGRTVLFVSHQMGSVARLCSRVACLGGGRVLKVGDTREVIDFYMSAGAECDGSRYELDAVRAAGKRLCIARADTADHEGRATVRFGHDEPIRVRFTLAAREAVTGAKIGISVRDRQARIVFRSEWALPDEGAGEGLRVETEIPPSTFCAGAFTFTLFIHQPFVQILDLAEDVLRITVEDRGSEFAVYEDKVDVGAVFVPCRWRAEPPEGPTSDGRGDDVGGGAPQP